MQRITSLSLSLVIGICLQAPPLFAQDEVPNTKVSHDVKADSSVGKEKSKAAGPLEKGTGQGEAVKSDKATGTFKAEPSASYKRSSDTSERSTQVVNQSVQRTTESRSQTNVARVHGDRGNQYNGQWVAGNTHSDWDRGANHQWNNHDYRWYDGGWLIIQDDSSPDYDETGAMVVRVKQVLAQQGYYKGHFSETVGPRTRQAISNYESDKGLPVNGQIDDPLLASLGLE